MKMGSSISDETGRPVRLGIGVLLFGWIVCSAAIGPDDPQATFLAGGLPAPGDSAVGSAGKSKTQAGSSTLRRWSEPDAAEASAGSRLTPDQRKRDAALRQRVTARWAALTQRDFHRAYTYETPEFRERATAADYTKTFGTMVEWRQVEVHKVEYHGSDSATVTLRVKYSFPDSTAGDDIDAVGFLKERWVYQDNSWWRSQKTEPLGYPQPAASSKAE